MPVTTRQNKHGRKVGGVFRFCTKASLYTLLVWIVNCSNSSQYGSNSYNVMNNSLGKAVDSRTLRLLAEAYEEAIEQDGPAVYEEAIEQDGPAVYDETIEQDGPAVYEEAIEQDGPVAYEEEAIEQVAQEVEQASENVGEISGEVAEEEQVVQEAPKNSEEEGKIKYNDDVPKGIRSTDVNKEKDAMDRYHEKVLYLRTHFEPIITYNFEEALKRCMAFDARKHGMDVDADPYGLLQKKNKRTWQTGYLRMYQNDFRNVPYIDDLKNNEELEEPYLERKYVRPHLTPDSPKTTALRRNVERKIYKEEDEEEEEVEEVKGKKKRRRRFCFF
ncbi:Uncharacterized protein PCOAH_00013170 [Plasmodium coatneyi]|uniref:Uncharacterized protein n=1 Tax=Plasmodium coatneyi TaxID=208452 RepID=A0A1B1DWH4_9APIC|nr:Uncharacterized protein PCOAH_00013170 [Plasmodium coatneyi]ANQ07100.1 Uncharacterized protein PCOAH_00013170 [Plasmodium coatneyi]